MSKLSRRHYSDAFKSQVLEDYFRSRMNVRRYCEKCDIPLTTFLKWLPTCMNEKKVVSLHSKSTNMDVSDQVLEDLRQENARLKQENEFQKLRVAGYEYIRQNKKCNF